jgi:hypothetical protein
MILFAHRFMNPGQLNSPVICLFRRYSIYVNNKQQIFCSLCYSEREQTYSDSSVKKTYFYIKKTVWDDCYAGKNPEARRILKGTVSRDLLLLVFFMNQFPPSPIVFH